MLQYYKLALVKAGSDAEMLKKELLLALEEIHNPQDKKDLWEWFKATVAEVKPT